MTDCPSRMESCCLSTQRKELSSGALFWKRPTQSKIERLTGGMSSNTDDDDDDDVRLPSCLIDNIHYDN